MPPWNGSCWFLGWLAALAMGVVATALIVMLFEPDIREVAWLIQRGPVEFAFLSLPAIGLIRIGFTCRLAKTIAWSAGVTFVAVSIGVIALGAMRSFFEACLVVLSVVSVVALLLSLGHAFRRWGPFEWFRGNRVQNQSQMHGGGRR